jgi:carboxymethylenebutenolidase
MRAYVARPETPNGAALLVLQEAFGVNEHMRTVAKRLAAKGYLAIAPELFHRTGEGFEGSYTDYESVKPHMAALTDEGMASDMFSAHAWLVSQEIPENRIGAVGFCMGGRAAFLANLELPLGASASFYGGRIAGTLDARAKDLHAPQLFCWGGKDDHILPEETRALSDAVREAGKAYIEATFSDGGHGFACDARDSYHAPSAREAWALTHAFFEEHLVPRQ